MPSKEERSAIIRKCRYELLGHKRRAMPEILTDLAQGLSPDLKRDHYGEGALIENFEKKIAACLGKPAAAFMPSGKMAQNIALRIWSDHRACKDVAFHPTSHLELYEEHAYSKLHGLKAHLLGEAHRPLALADLKACSTPLAALLLELPQREIGGVLSSWEELVAQCEWARSKGIALHMDGARLWESQPFYGRPYAEIAGLFDSVYVSFYKGLGGIAGAVLAGSEDFIAEARVWQRRHGGTLISLFPYIVAAERGFDERLGRMAQYRDKAVELAEILIAHKGVRAVPQLPQTNMMHAYFTAPIEKLNQTSFEIARDYGVYLFHEFDPTDDPAVQMIELTVGDATLELSRARITELLTLFFERLKQ